MKFTLPLVLLFTTVCYSLPDKILIPKVLEIPEQQHRNVYTSHSVYQPQAFVEYPVHVIDGTRRCRVQV